MSLMINPNSPHDTITSETKFALHLQGHGYLCNDSNWMERLDDGRPLEHVDFQLSGDICRFDEPPFDLFDRTSHGMRHNMSVHRLTIITHIEEIVV